MKFTLSWAVFCLSLLLSSCLREIPIPPGQSGSIHIHLTTSSAGEEIIFSESNGKILLDTMSPYPSPLVATLHTNQTLVDLTTIVYDTTESRYDVTTYKAVDPSNWAAVEPGSYSGPNFPQLSSTNATVVYTNTPAIPNGQFLIDDYVSGYNLTNGTPAAGYLNVTYASYNPGNYVYLLLPYSGLYNFHLPPQGKADTVDLSRMDTAVELTYTKPAGYSLGSSLVYGIMDTTDLARTLMLYNTYGGSGLPDVEYPQKRVQKMEMFISIFDNSSTHYDQYYSYGDTIHSAPNWPSETDYTISANQPSAFSVAFTGVHPADYVTHWITGNVFFVIDAPSDSTSLNPQNMLGALKAAKLLQGQNLSGLTLNGFFFDIPGGLDYAGYNSFLHNPALWETQHLASLMSHGALYY
jgi:hypothetical protein